MISIFLLLGVAAVALCTGLVVGMPIGYRIHGRAARQLAKIPTCPHVWGKWQIVHKADKPKVVWGQRHDCELCGLAEWRRWCDSIARGK